MPANYPELLKAAQRLKQAAPAQYVEVVRELDKICHGLHIALVGADSAAILTVQGRAQQANDLLNAFDPPQPKQPTTVMT